MKPTLVVVVDRSRWLRGEGEEASMLLRSLDGKMCCLGFACLAAGHTEDQIRDVVTPGGISDKRLIGCLLPTPKMPQYGLAMGTNDDPLVPEHEREAAIIHDLAQVGIAMSFVDGPLAEGGSDVRRPDQE